MTFFYHNVLSVYNTHKVPPTENPSVQVRFNGGNELVESIIEWNCTGWVVPSFSNSLPYIHSDQTEFIAPKLILFYANNKIWQGNIKIGRWRTDYMQGICCLGNMLYTPLIFIMWWHILKGNIFLLKCVKCGNIEVNTPALFFVVVSKSIYSIEKIAFYIKIPHKMLISFVYIIVCYLRWIETKWLEWHKVCYLFFATEDNGWIINS